MTYLIFIVITFCMMLYIIQRYKKHNRSSSTREWHWEGTAAWGERRIHTEGQWQSDGRSAIPGAWSQGLSYRPLGRGRGCAASGSQKADDPWAPGRKAADWLRTNCEAPSLGMWCPCCQEKPWLGLPQPCACMYSKI